jgi:hypothetical protein
MTAATSPPPPLFTGPRVLVPITVTAMVINEFLLRGKTFATVPPVLSTFAHTFLPGQPQPFAQRNPGVGVTLHWILPGALRQGAADEKSGKTNFPKVPNRWLITRRSPDPTAASGCTVAAWLVQSDHTDQTQPVGANQFALFGTDGTFSLTYLGRQVSLAAWTGETSGAELFLTAIGDGNAAFTAYTAGVDNVFAFQDSLSTGSHQGDTIALGPLSYSVVGWYSDPAQDFLASATTPVAWADLMKKSGWAVDQPAAPIQPPSLLCHGAVADVFWPGATATTLCTDDGRPILGVPLTTQTAPNRCPGQDMTTAVAAIGNTALDALASLAAYQLETPASATSSPDALALLQAFFYDDLIDYGSVTGEVRLTEKVRQSWFGSQPGGTCWDIVPIRNGGPSSVASPAPLPPDAAIVDGLAELNRRQRALDQAVARLAAQQKTLYQLWWKQQRAPKANLGQTIIAQIDEAYAATTAVVQQLSADATQAGSVQAVTAQRDRAKAAVEQALESGNTQLRLAEQGRQQYWKPADPVLLIQGALGSYKHSAPELTRGAPLSCRLTGQTLDALTVTYDALTGSVALQAGADAACSGQTCAVLGYPDLQLAVGGVDLQTQFTNSQLPPEAAALVLEAYLLDATNAATLLNIALAKMQQQPENVATLVEQFQEQQQGFVTGGGQLGGLSAGAAADGTGFVPPDALAVAIWQAPWSPLYLDWQVRWYPATDVSPASDGDGVRLTQWAFAPSSGTPLHYQWTGGLPASAATFQEFNGRSLLTPGATELLGSWLNTRLHEYPPISNPYLMELADRMATWDVLAQSMSGFNDQLVQLWSAQHLPPPAADAALMGSGDQAIPMPGATASSVQPFWPLRAGVLMLEALWVVDDYGQVFDPLSSPVCINVVAGPAVGLDPQGSVIAPGESPQSLSYSLFGPAAVQASRLDFSLIAAGRSGPEAEPIDIDPTDTPVCGYLLRNVLDRELAVYDNVGGLLGSLYLAGTGVLQWEPNPDRTTSVGQPPDIHNAYLLAIVTGLLGRSDSGAAFAELLEELDRIVTKLDLSGSHYDQGLATLVGRPIAVVRAKLRLEFAGGPLYDQSWAATNTWSTGGIEAIRWPIRLGGLKLPYDGLYGFFTDDGDAPAAGYRTLHAVYEDEDLLGNAPGYVAGGNLSLSFGGRSRYVTMLMEPNSSVYAISGILPDTAVALPGAYTAGAVQNMDVMFRTGPVLTDAHRIGIVKPADVYGQWSWVEHSGVQISTRPIVGTDAKATFDDAPPVLRAGWLRLKSAFAEAQGTPGKSTSPARAPYFRPGRRPAR